MFNVNNKDTRTTLITRHSGVFIINFEHISHLVLVFLLLTLSRKTLAELVQSKNHGSSVLNKVL